MACRKHLKRLPRKDDDEVSFGRTHLFAIACKQETLLIFADIVPIQFFPMIVYETTLKLEKMPEEPEYQKIPEYFVPVDIKKVPAFEVTLTMPPLHCDRVHESKRIVTLETAPFRRLFSILVWWRPQRCVGSFCP